MLTGIPPFYDKDRNKIIGLIVNEKKIKFKEFHSHEAKDLIRKLLNKNPNKRLGYNRGAEEIKEHPFFSCIDW